MDRRRRWGGVWRTASWGEWGEGALGLTVFMIFFADLDLLESLLVFYSLRYSGLSSLFLVNLNKCPEWPVLAGTF